MGTSLRVLIVEDSEDDATLLELDLRRAGYNPDMQRVETPADMRTALREQTWDIVISDYSMPRFSGPDALSVLQDSGLDIPFIVVSGVIREDAAVDIMKAGADDYVMKGSLRRLIPAIGRELREAEKRRKNKRLENQLVQLQKMESFGRLASGVAHDFNNVLTPIVGYCELVQMALPSDHPACVYAQEIEASANKAMSLIRRLKALSQQQTAEPELIGLNKLILDFIRIPHRLISENIELVTELSPAVGLVNVDPVQIESVLVNLVINARDAMPDGGTINIETRNATIDQKYVQELADVAPGEYVVLSVHDTGTGMTDEVKSHLFEPFFTTKAPGQGTGLGLAACYESIKQSNGHIVVDSEVGRGTSFVIYFPRTEEASSYQATEDHKDHLTQGIEPVATLQ